MFKKKYFSSTIPLFFAVIISISLLLLTPFPAFAGLNNNITSEQTLKIQELLDTWRTRLRIPGLAMGIFLPGGGAPLTFVSGTTTIDGTQPITPNTLFQIGSISKSFTSMIILQLAAQGSVNLDDPITKYLPQYPQWQNVTIRQLLNHTSGIFDYTKTGKFIRIRTLNPEAGMTPAELVAMAQTHRSYFPAGKGWKYSNTNYVLAGMIIEVTTRQPIRNIMNFYLHGNKRMFLQNTFYLPGIYTPETITRMAHGYNSGGEDVTQRNMSWAFTAGALVSTTPDLLTWWRNIFQTNIMSTQQLEQMMSLVCEHTVKATGCIAGQPAPRLDALQIDKRYGLGIIQSAQKSQEIGTVWWHNGSTQGYKAIVMWYPQSNIYMALIIDRDPGFLLTPNLPVIRNTMHVLLNSYKRASAYEPTHASPKTISPKIRIKRHHHKNFHPIHYHEITKPQPIADESQTNTPKIHKNRHSTKKSKNRKVHGITAAH